jgi:hypothetical protein
MEVASEDASVVISEDMPIVDYSHEKSLSNRFSKFVQRIGQNEWISEFDFFSVPLKLNFNGEDTFKTEFGGLVYLLIGISCIVLTIIMQFPYGIALNAPITYYELTADAGNTETVFDNSENFFTLYLYSKKLNQRASGDLFKFLVRGFSVWQVVDGVGKKL